MIFKVPLKQFIKMMYQNQMILKLVQNFEWSGLALNGPTYIMHWFIQKYMLLNFT